MHVHSIKELRIRYWWTRQHVRDGVLRSRKIQVLDIKLRQLL